MNCYMLIIIWCLSGLAHCRNLCGNSVIKVKSVHQASFAEAKAWPWEISLQNKKGSHFCGGTVVGDRWVLTAASCRTNASEMVIKLGTLDLKSGRTYLIKEVHYHPQYDEKTKDNNVTLIELAQRIEYSDEVQPICLPNKDKRLERDWFSPVGEIQWVGNRISKSDCRRRLNPTSICILLDPYSYLHNVDPDKLIQVGVRTFDFDKCSIEYQGLNKKTHFCATVEGKDTRDTCQTDHGSPLVKEVAGRWYQFGIVTMGKSEQNPCKNKEKPAVYPCCKIHQLD